MTHPGGLAPPPGTSAGSLIPTLHARPARNDSSSPSWIPKQSPWPRGLAGPPPRLRSGATASSRTP
eukprot:11197742-Lingulodinium_polyedra.AAC.1